MRPALEFLFLPYVLQSLGLVMIVINAVLLALLALTSVLEIEGVVPLLVGAVLAGVVGFFLDSLLGLTPPVIDDASARAARSERAVRIAGVSERLRVMQLYGILLQYTVDLAFDWALAAPGPPPDAGVAVACRRCRSRRFRRRSRSGSCWRTSGRPT